ncbi:MAG: EthD family reductase [Caulobacter sp.]|nr:EthD family reductase [Caulobacter sp.]
MVIFSVLYPAKAGARFDEAYYHATHIPLAREAFGEALTDVQVIKGLSSPDGGPAPFVLITHLTFASPEAMAGALGGQRGAEVAGDVVNFTDIVPVVQVGAPV